MTIHKSQGSEFSHTFVVFTGEMISCFHMKLVYTEVTRAINQVTIFFKTCKIWNMAVGKATERQSGLKSIEING